jgi:hypothetical protein
MMIKNEYYMRNIDNISYFCSKVQARSAFAMYLIRVQQRLVTEGNPCSQDDSDALNEQMVMFQSTCIQLLLN